MWLRIITVAFVVAILAGCAVGPFSVRLTATGYGITRYVNYAPVVLYNVHNPSEWPLTRVVVTARCEEDQYETLHQDYASSEFSIAPGETIAQVTLQHVDGWPYFTDFKVYCTFDAENRAFPTQPDATVELQ